MQTAWIGTKRRVTRRITRAQAVWHSDNVLPTLKQLEKYSRYDI